MKTSSRGNVPLVFLQRKSAKIRIKTLQMVGRGKGSHLGPSFSCIDLLTALYFRVLSLDMSKPYHPGRDRFVLSKGHACAGLYVTLSERGFIKKDLLKTYLQNGSLLHLSTYGLPGYDYLSGALGHGFNIAVGLALAAKHDKKNYKVYVMISDGECDEGATWEAALFASHHKLDNLVVLLDYNKMQAIDWVENVLSLEPLGKKWESFGFAVREIDGHDMRQIVSSLESAPFFKTMPSLIMAHTVKGKGVSFMENSVDWHYLTPSVKHVRQGVMELKFNNRKKKR